MSPGGGDETPTLGKGATTPMSRSRSPLAMLALALLMALVGAGLQTTASAQDEVTLRVWDQFTGPEGTVVDKIYD